MLAPKATANDLKHQHVSCIISLAVVEPRGKTGRNLEYLCNFSLICVLESLSSRKREDIG